MGMSNAAQLDALKHILANVTWAGVGDVTGLPGSATAGSAFIALHTADPGAAGNQTTNEATYTGYARVAISRALASWVFSGSSPTQAANAAAVTFGLCTAGTNTITHFSVGIATSGAGEIIVSAALAASLSVSSGVTPSFAIGQLAVTDI